MPRYTPSEDEMDDLYESESTPQESTESEQTPEQEMDNDKMSPTAIIDLKVLQGPGGQEVKEGDEIVVRVDKVYGDEAEISYAPAKSKESKSEEPSSDEEIDSLNNEQY